MWQLPMGLKVQPGEFNFIAQHMPLYRARITPPAGTKSIFFIYLFIFYITDSNYGEQWIIFG